MFKRLFVSLAVVAFAMVGLSFTAEAASPVNAKSCQASDRTDIDVNKKTDTVTVRGDTSTLGNNYSCYSNITAAAGNTVTFDFTGICGGGTPRVLLRFADGHYENTFDTGTCTMTSTNTGTVTYTIAVGGTIDAFALIHDSDNNSTTYRNLVIAGTKINF